LEFRLTPSAMDWNTLGRREKGEKKTMLLQTEVYEPQNKNLKFRKKLVSERGTCNKKRVREKLYKFAARFSLGASKFAFRVVVFPSEAGGTGKGLTP